MNRLRVVLLAVVTLPLVPVVGLCLGVERWRELVGAAWRDRPDRPSSLGVVARSRVVTLVTYRERRVLIH